MIAANLALDVAAMWVEPCFILLSNGRDLPASWMEGFALASLFGQIVILGIWSALFPGSNLLRVLCATLVLCASAGILTWIVQQIAPAAIEYRSWAGLSGLPLIVVVFYTVQIPFWILRFLLRWRIALDPSDQVKPPETRRYTMLQMLGWMAFLSVPLELGQVCHGRCGQDVVFVLGSLAIVSWLYSVLYLWATLGANRLVWGLIVCVPASIVITIVGSQFFLWLYPRSQGVLLYQVIMFV